MDVCTALEKQPTFQARKGVMENWRRMVEREMPADIGGISKKLEALTPAIAVNRDRYRNRLDAASIRIIVAARSPKTESVEAAQRVENFYYRLFHDLARKRTSTVWAPNERALDYKVWAGCGVRHLDWTADIYEKILGNDLEGMQAGLKDGIQGNPFQMHAPDPVATFWDRDFSTVCEIGKQQVSILVDENEHIHASDLTSDTMPENTTFWDKTVKVYQLETSEYTYLVSGDVEPQMLGRWPNLAGRPRYSFSAGQLTSSHEAHKMFEPLIKPLYSLGFWKNIIDTLLITGAYHSGRPLMQWVENKGGSPQDFLSLATNADQDRVLVIGEQEQLPTRDGYHLEPVFVPTGEYLDNAKQAVDAEFDKYAFPIPLSPGAQESQASSGYQFAQQTEQAGIFIEPTLKHEAAAWHEQFMLAADMLMELDVPVTMTTTLRAQGLGHNFQEAFTVKPEDFKDIDLEVSFESISETRKFAEQEADQRLYENRLISKPTLMAKLHDDPVAEQERIDFDAADELGKQQALEAVAAAIQEQGGDLVKRIMLQEGAPQTVETGPQQPGGPAPGQATRTARPAGLESSPGLGRPLVEPVQTQPGEPAGVR